MLAIIRFNLIFFTFFPICIYRCSPLSCSSTKNDLYANSVEKYISKTNNNTENQKNYFIFKQISNNSKKIEVIRSFSNDLHNDFIYVTVATDNISKYNSIKLFLGDEELGEIYGRYLAISTLILKTGIEFSIEDIYEKKVQKKPFNLVFVSMNKDILINGRHSYEIIINTTQTLPNKLMNFINERYLLFNAGLILLILLIVVLCYFQWERSCHPDVRVPQDLWLYILDTL